jgi:hypothetical protein
LGHEEGCEKGRAALRGLIIELLAARGIVVDAAIEARIHGCEDLNVLRQWARRAVEVASADELLATRTGDS